MHYRCNVVFARLPAVHAGQAPARWTASSVGQRRFVLPLRLRGLTMTSVRTDTAQRVGDLDPRTRFYGGVQTPIQFSWRSRFNAEPALNQEI